MHFLCFYEFGFILSKKGFAVLLIRIQTDELFTMFLLPAYIDGVILLLFDSNASVLNSSLF